MNTKILLLFFVLNFGALALGSLLIGSGITSDWYVELQKAPWTPPGYMFGIAWTVIMVCYSIYMTYAWQTTEDKKLLLILFGIQWVLNISWNFMFFRMHETLYSFAIISALTLLIFYFLLGYRYELKAKSFLILPYFIWLLIATSLNGYIYLKN